MKPYSIVRQATGSFSPVHSQAKKPAPGRCGSGLGSSIRTPSSALALARSSLPSCRAPARPVASSGRPTTVTDRPTPTLTVTTT